MNNNLIIIGIISAILIIFSLAVVIIFQQRKIKDLSTPKYGFLGKTLAPSLVLIMLTAGMIGGVYLVNQEQVSGPVAEAGVGEIGFNAECIPNSEGAIGTVPGESILNIDINVQNISSDTELTNRNLEVYAALNPNESGAERKINTILIEEDVLSYNMDFDFVVKNGEENTIVVSAVLGEPYETLASNVFNYTCE